MVGVKGYDAAILKALTRHDVWIVSKASNANTITHYVNGASRRCSGSRRTSSRNIRRRDPIRTVALVCAVGSTLAGLQVARRGLNALADAGIEPIAVQETGRHVDVQFVVTKEEMAPAIKALHYALVESEARERDAPVLRSVA